MPSFIPNQPITWNGLEQPCLNNDPTRYAMLMQGCDRWKAQIQNSPCDSDTGTICDVDINQIGDYIINSQFTSATEWQVIDGTINTAGQFGYMFIDAMSNFESNIYQTITPYGAYGDAGSVICRLKFTISALNLASSGTFYVNADFSVVGGSPGSVLYADTPAQGSYDVFCELPNGCDIINIGFKGTDGDILYVKDFSLQPYSPCWRVAHDDNGSNSDARVSAQAWSYSTVAGKGVFTANPGWDFYSTISFPCNSLSVALLSTVAPGTVLEISYTVNITAGAIYASLGDTAGVTRITSGTFTEIITATNAADHLAFFTTDDFAGDIRLVSGYRYGACHTFDIVDAVTGMDVVTGIEPEYDNDKITFNVNPCSVPYYVGEELNDWETQDGCYQIRFNNCCDDTSTLSDTVIRYLRTDEHPCTVLVEATCNGRGLGFDFTGDFSLLQRLRVLRYGSTYNNRGNDAGDSAGNKRRTFARSEKVVKCLFDRVDEATLDAINTQMLCDEVTFDDEEVFFPVQDVEPDWIGRGKYNLAQVEVELQKKNSITFNQNLL